MNIQLEKVYVFYSFAEKHITFMFMKPAKLTSDQLEELRNEARRRIPGASMEVIVS